jgi:hypothetical protein
LSECYTSRITSEVPIKPIEWSFTVECIMQKRINNIFDHVVNKGLIMNKYRGSLQAKQMMENAGLPSDVILRVLTKPQRIRSSDWRE